MSLKLRPGIPEDVEACGRICYDAFKAIAEQHNFPSEVPSLERAAQSVSNKISDPRFHAVVAELDGHIVGSNFLDERSTIAGVGPISVDPAAQNAGVGRKLMQALLGRAAERGFPGVRLATASFHNRSLVLYSKVGFQVRELLATMQGPRIRAAVPGCSVRPASESDLDSCNRVCAMVHGHGRDVEFLDAAKQGSALVVERDGRITGYTTGVTYFGHTVGATNEDLKAMIAATPEYLGPGFLVPTRNTELFTWCLDNGLRIVHPMTLMSIGLYNEPKGAYMPSVHY